MTAKKHNEEIHETEAKEPVTKDGNEAAGLDASGQLTKELAEAKDRMLRLQADFDNFRKRTQKEKEDWYKYASAGIMEKLLPVLDNFERALLAINVKNEEAQGIRDGVDMIYRQLTEILDKEGLEPITAVGEIFDPNLHEALMQVPAEKGQQEGQITEELRRGYRFKDRVIRHTMVKVAKNH